MTRTLWKTYDVKAVPPSPRPSSVPSLARRTFAEEDPGKYEASEGLIAAVNVAIALSQPLLLTGEPGTGKTQLAYHIARQVFGIDAEVLVFNTKTTSVARDLFYQYDAIRHFRDAQLDKLTGDGAKRAIDVEQYISYQALGRAILGALPVASRPMNPDLVKVDPEPSQSVVLIDEIDKAPRDLPNDVLDEIDRMRFDVKETRGSYEAPAAFRPIVIMTSNSEKVLPDPFLRRCVFFHLEFPDQEGLKKIVTKRLGLDSDRAPQTVAWVDEAIGRFLDIRKRLKRKPSTGELLAWLRVLEQLQQETGSANPLRDPAVRHTMPVVGKNKEDLKHAAE